VDKCQGCNLVLDLAAPVYDPNVFLGVLIAAWGRSSRFVEVQKQDAQIGDAAGAK
jgi:hypothetical protein